MLPFAGWLSGARISDLESDTFYIIEKRLRSAAFFNPIGLINFSVEVSKFVLSDSAVNVSVPR